MRTHPDYYLSFFCSHWLFWCVGSERWRMPAAKAPSTKKQRKRGSAWKRNAPGESRTAPCARSRAIPCGNIVRPSDSGTPVELSVLADPAELNEYLTKTFQKAGRLDAALIEELTDLAVSQNGNPAIQDYGLQFLGAAVGELGTNHESSVRSAISVLRDGSSFTDSTLAGTSLLSLRKASAARPHLVSNEEISRVSESIAGDPSYSDASRTTALLVMEQEHHPRTHEVAQTILHESGIGPILRQTARAVAER